jgi:trk system potassium uptake protein TrkA
MKQFAIIGLGNFGHYLALNLYKKGHEVLVIDKNASQVQEIKDQVSQASLLMRRIERLWKALA